MSKARLLKWRKRMAWPLSKVLRLRRVPKPILKQASERFGMELLK